MILLPIFLLHLFSSCAWLLAGCGTTTIDEYRTHMAEKQGIATSILPGRAIYVVALPVKVDKKMIHGHALFAESELSRTA